MSAPPLTELRELYDADRVARTAAHPPRSGSCRYCGYPWIPYAGTRLDGHTQCWIGEATKAAIAAAYAEPTMTLRALADALDVSIAIVRAWCAWVGIRRAA